MQSASCARRSTCPAAASTAGRTRPTSTPGASRSIIAMPVAGGSLSGGVQLFTPAQAGLHPSNKSSGEKLHGVLTSDFDLNALSTTDLDMRLSAAMVTVGQSKLGRTAFGANLRGGALALSVGEAQVYGGIAKGSIGMATVEPRGRVRVSALSPSKDSDSSTIATKAINTPAVATESCCVRNRSIKA